MARILLIDNDPQVRTGVKESVLVDFYAQNHRLNLQEHKIKKNAGRADNTKYYKVFKLK